MRRFRLKANTTRWSDSFIKGLVYNETDVVNREGEQVMDFVTLYPEDWEEVFETILNHQNQFTTDSTQLHKDTDLGYYAGLAMQGLCANGKFTEGIAYSPCLSELSVSIAKELIKQLNEETK